MRWSIGNSSRSDEIIESQWLMIWHVDILWNGIGHFSKSLLRQVFLNLKLPKIGSTFSFRVQVSHKNLGCTCTILISRLVTISNSFVYYLSQISFNSDMFRLFSLDLKLLESFVTWVSQTGEAFLGCGLMLQPWYVPVSPSSCVVLLVNDVRGICSSIVRK